MRKLKLLSVPLSFLILGHFALAQVTSPEEFLGFNVGTAKELADMNQIVEYFRILGRESNRILVREVGLTTMGNPFIVAVITSADNHRDLDSYRKYQQLLADPRKISDQ
jgi:hypothetical protein